MTQPRFDPVEVARFENATWSRCAETYMDAFGALVREAIGPLRFDKRPAGAGTRLDRTAEIHGRSAADR